MDKEPVKKGGSDASESSSQEAVGGACEMQMTPKMLQSIIKERKAERKGKAEETRLEGLRRIAEMNSKIGISPLEQFPKEIWLMILGDITPRAKASMYQLHPVFQDLMEDQKIRDILLPLVIDHKIPLLKTLLRDVQGELDMDQAKILRLISKEVRNSVDQWIEDDILNSMRNLCGAPIKLNPISFINEAARIRLNLLLPNVETPTRLITRSLKLVFMGDVDIQGLEDDDDDDEELSGQRFQKALITFCAKTTEMLRKIGDQILYLELSFFGVSNEDSGLNILQVYRIIRQYLLLMPHLKWLQLTAMDLDLHRHSLLNQPGWLAKAKAALQAYPVPRMNELERADFWEWKGFPVWDAVLAANPHVKIHKFCGVAIHPDDEYERFAEPSVLSLALEAVDGGVRVWDLPMLQTISDSNWKLVTLTFGIRSHVEINPVLQCLEKFPTLQNLFVRLNDVTIGKKIDFLRLPNLKTFILDLGPEMKVDWSGEFQFFFSLQFLLQCSKLELLTWDTMLNISLNARCKMNATRLDGMVDFKGGLGKLRDCNIWEVFPRLRSVDVIFWDKDGDHCKRKYSSGKLVSEYNSRLWTGLKSFL